MTTVSARPWTPKEVARSLEMRAAGMKALAIGRRLGRSQAALYQQWRRLGHATPRLTRRQVGLIRELARKGQADPAIAAKLGVTRNTVLYHRKKAGLPGLSRSEASRRANYTRRRAGWQTTFETASDGAAILAAKEGWPPVTAGLVRVLAAVESGHDTARKLSAATGVRFKSAREKLRLLRGLGHLTVRFGDTWFGEGIARRREKVYELSAAVKTSRCSRRMAS